MPQPPQDQVLIAFGSSLGDRHAILLKALEEIASFCGSVKTISSFYNTEPVGGVAREGFVNGACLIETDLSPADLMERLLEIETLAGRVRTVRWGDRTLDLDIIAWRRADGSFLQMKTELIEIPHPRAQERDFVLRPMRELVPDWLEGEWPAFATTSHHTATSPAL